MKQNLSFRNRGEATKMFRKRIITLAIWSISFVSDHRKYQSQTYAFRQPRNIRQNRWKCDGEPRFEGFSIGTAIAREALNNLSASRSGMHRSNPPGKRVKRRKLNSDIFRLRKQRNGNYKAEERLEEAIVYMINGNNQDGIPFEVPEHLPDIVSFHAVISSHAKAAHKDNKAAKRALGLLERMKELSSVFPYLTPTIYSYNAVMESFVNQVKKRRAGYQERSSEDREVILRLYQEAQDVGLAPDTYTRNMILASISHNSEQWRQLESWAFDYLDGDSDSVSPDRSTYHALFRTYSVFGDAKGAEKMLRKLLINKQKRLGLGTTQTELKPSKYWFDSVFKAMAVSDTKGSHERVAELLKEMKKLVECGHDHLRPDTTTCNNILNVYAENGDLDLAVGFLKEMEESSNKLNKLDARAPLFDSVSYTTVLKAFATAQKNISSTKTNSTFDMAEKATKLFESMQEKSISPTIFTYNTLISIWANVGSRDAMYKAEDLLRQIRHPDSVSYSTLIHGWSKTQFPEAGSRARKLFNEVLRLPSSRHRGKFSPTILCNSVISAYAKSNDKKDSLDNVESLLAQLEGRFLSGDEAARPDKVTFLSIINLYAKMKVSDAEERCDVILDRMSYYSDALQSKELEPDRVVYNAVLNALAKSKQPEVITKVEDILTMMESSPNDLLRPDIVTYATVIDCFTKCGDKNIGSQRADELLRFVEGTYRGGDEMLKPNFFFYSAILQAWAKTGKEENCRKAENLLQRNIDLYAQGHDYAKPHTIVFNAVMDALARSNMVGASSRAEELLEELESLYQLGDDDMRPSKRSYNALILAYRNEGRASGKAEELLTRMEKMSASGRSELKPDVVSYNNVIAAIVEDNDSENTADRAQALLDRMEALGIKPDGRTYSPVIEAWLRRNDEKGHALADVMLTQFLNNVEASKKQNLGAKEDSLYEDAVWNMINTYRENSDNDFYSQLASRGWISGG